MATRLAEPEPWCLVRDVLCEAADVEPSRTFDAEAEVQAGRMRGIRRDWAGRPCVTWSVAAELLTSLRAERARVAAEHEERVIAAAEAHLASIPRGIPMAEMAAGVSPAEMLFISDPMRGSRRRSVVEDALQNDGGLIYTPVGGQE